MFSGRGLGPGGVILRHYPTNNLTYVGPKSQVQMGDRILERLNVTTIYC
jgi:hypothetical protein